jgi:hypothetical protein
MLRARSRVASFAALLTCAIPALSQTPSDSAIPSKFKPVLEEQFVCYWTAEPGWHTDLMLRNNMENAALAVTPAVRLDSGTEIPLAPATVPPSSVISVNLHDALMQSHPEAMMGANPYGSVLIRHTALSHSNLYASVMIHDDGFPIVYHVDGTAMEPESGPGSHEGIWWLPNATTKGYLILTNMSQNQQSGVLWLYDQVAHSSKQTVTLPPRQTLRLPLSDFISTSGLAGDKGGVSFRMDEGVGRHRHGPFALR